jgi:hypothetical protein
MIDKLYKLFTSCQIVKGYKNALIYDLHRAEIHKISLEFADFLQHTEVIQFDNNWQDEKKYLIENDIIFQIENESESELFPDIDFSFFEPNLITNAVVQGINIEDASYKINLLSELGLRHLVLIVNNLSIQEVMEFVNRFQSTRLYTVQLIVMDDTVLSDFIQADSDGFFQNQTLIQTVRITSDSNFQSESKRIIAEKIDFTTNQSYRLNINLFSESQTKHSYFNRKVVIDFKGNIKNGLLTERVFGNIYSIKKSEELRKIILESAFQHLWLVKKDDCNICKDCELRFMCIDNREPLMSNNGFYYHKGTCDYNPYIGKWNGDEDYLTLEESGVISNEDGFEIDVNQLQQ